MEDARETEGDLLSDVLNIGQPEAHHLTEAMIQTSCPKCGKGFQLSDLVVTRSGTWETVYRCPDDSESVCVLLHREAPATLFFGPGRVLHGKWKLRNRSSVRFSVPGLKGIREYPAVV